MKKGMADTNKQLYWTLILLPFIIIYVTLILFGVPEIITIKTQLTERLQDNLLQDKLLSSLDCFAYEENENIKTGQIKLSKFTKENMDSCLQDYPIKRGFALVLVYDGQDQKEIISDMYQPAAKLSMSYERPIIIIDGNQRHNGILEMKVSY